MKFINLVLLIAFFSPVTGWGQEEIALTEKTAELRKCTRMFVSTRYITKRGPFLTRRGGGVIKKVRTKQVTRSEDGWCVGNLFLQNEYRIPFSKPEQQERYEEIRDVLNQNLGEELTVVYEDSENNVLKGYCTIFSFIRHPRMCGIKKLRNFSLLKNSHGSGILWSSTHTLFN